MRLFITPFVLLALIHSVNARCEPVQPSPFRPALFGSDSHSLTTLLQCPSGPEFAKDATVFCQARIKPSGKPHRSYCFTKQQEAAAYQSLTNQAVDKATFQPASVNGESVEVLFSFRVAYSWNGDTCTFAAIPNWGFNDPKSGLRYTAPQEILSKGVSWADLGRTYILDGRVRSNLSSLSYVRRGILFSMSVLISDEGVPSDARLEANSGASDSEIQRSLQTILQSRFIPGFKDNQPVEMRYFEIYHLDRDY
jgi:hypothetical protein